MNRAVERPLSREIALGALVVLALLYSTMFHAVSAPNERSRIYLAVALIDHATLEIGEPVARFGWILDVAKFDNKVYSDKAPGSSLLAAVLYGGVRLFSEPQDWGINELLQLMRRGLMVPLGVIGFLALRSLLRRSGAVPAIIDVVSLGWILGSAAFHYSTAFYGHQIVAVAFVLALLLIQIAEAPMTAGRLRVVLPAVLAGACTGLAGLTEYQAGVPAVLVALYVTFGPKTRRIWRVAAFAAGALPFLVGLGVYNSIAFGGPFEVSYHHLSSATHAAMHTQGVGGVTSPRLENFNGALFSLHRGLLVTSPMFLLAPPGVWALWSGGKRRLALLLAGVGLYFMLFISSSNVWDGGWSFGPRLLVAGMGFWAPLVAMGAQRWLASAWMEGLLRGAVVAGVLYNQVVHAFFPELPTDVENPIVDGIAVLYRADLVTPNLLTSLGAAQGVRSLLPLVAAVGVVIVVVLGRRMRARGWRPRVFAISLTLLPSLALAFYVWLSPSRTPIEHEAFARFVAELSAQEPLGSWHRNSTPPEPAAASRGAE